MTDLRGLWQWRRWLREPLLTIPLLALLLIGAATVCSATLLVEHGRGGLIVRHIISIGVGIAFAAVLAWLPLRVLHSYSLHVFIVAVVLLAVVLVAGEVQHGARRWLDLGFFHLQPSEPAKLAFVLFLASFLAHKRHDLRHPRWLLAALGLVALPFLLVLKEPDLGTALAFPGIGVVMLIWAGIPWATLALLASPLAVTGIALLPHLAHTSVYENPSVLWRCLWIPFVAAGVVILRSRGIATAWVVIFALVLVTLALGAPIIWESLESYQRSRVESFLSPESDRSGAGYQVIQSKIAIGSGKATGQGYGRGSQKALAFLPRQHTDFIYSVVGEEWGFLGSILVLGLFAVLVFRGLSVGMKVRSSFASLLAVGASALIFYHMAVNVAMTLGLAPVTGLPLPFVSYGGSFMVVATGAVGLILNAALRGNQY
ncbi:MAG: rod shape-determining protein RodA [Candidatus Eisenbacteria bacterium]|nr:rod shape-determining protein RodA [Candidatus Eisenbacteria bacterium]